MFKINFTEALKLDQPTRTYEKLPKFPSLDIDISVVIDRTTEIKTLEEAILQADKNLVKETRLFDIYEGENVAANKKAVAFKVTLLAEDRTVDAERNPG